MFNCNEGAGLSSSLWHHLTTSHVLVERMSNAQVRLLTAGRRSHEAAAAPHHHESQSHMHADGCDGAEGQDGDIVESFVEPFELRDEEMADADECYGIRPIEQLFSSSYFINQLSSTSESDTSNNNNNHNSISSNTNNNDDNENANKSNVSIHINNNNSTGSDDQYHETSSANLSSATVSSTDNEHVVHFQMSLRVLNEC